MGILKKTFLRASQMPAFKIALLLFFMGMAFIKTVALVFMDISAVQLYLTQTSHLSIGFDLIFVSVLFSYVGYKSRLLYKHQGYGGFVIVTFLICFLTVLIGLIETHFPAVFDILFVSKYIYFALINAVFWSVITRFIPLKTNSLKFLLILLSEALGYTVGGFCVYFINIGAYGLLYYAMALLLMWYAGLFILVQLKPVSAEQFLIPSGEAQDFTEQKLSRTLLLFSFFTMTGFCLMNYIFYMYTVQQYSGVAILNNMALFWGIFGCIELLISACFIPSRYFYLLSVNMLILIGAIACMALGLTHKNYTIVFSSFLFFITAFHICYNAFIFTLLKILKIKQGHKSINLKRQALIEPVGFMLGGVLVTHIPQFNSQIYILLGLCLLLLILFIQTMQIYGNVILKSLKLREWIGDEIILTAPQTLKYINENLKNDSTDDIIYFLRILEVAKHPAYYKYVLKSLKHQSEAVRLFALQRIQKSDDLERYQSAVQFVFNTDKSANVQAQALTVLIQIADLKEDTALLNTYESFLDDRRLKTGAMIGFLNIGNNYDLLAMDGLQQLIHSQMTADKLSALYVMKQAPRAGLIRQLIPLLKSSDTLIANEALKVAGLMKHPEALPIILNSLDDVPLQENALYALQEFGIKSYPAIEKNIYNSDISDFRKKTLILFLARQTNFESRQILLRALKRGNPKLRKTIIRGMIDSGIFWKHHSKYKFLKDNIEQDTQRIIWLSAFLDKYKNAPTAESQDAFSFLNRAMSEELKIARELIFYQLLLLNNTPMFQKAVRILLENNYEAYPMALAVIQDILPHKLFKTIHMVTQLPFVRKKDVITLAIKHKEAVQDISDLILKPPFYLPPWIVSCVLYCLRKLNDKNALPAVCECLKSTDLLILESAVLTLNRLESNKQEVNRILLSVPTGMLVKLPLDNLLKNQEN